jgi:hypothetical protein
MMERIVKSSGGFEHIIRIHAEKLGTVETAPRKRGERKYNMRIKRHDLILLDELAQHSGRPRSEIINELLHRILLREFSQIRAVDARILVAMKADEDAEYDPLSSQWMVDALQPEIDFMIRNALEHGEVIDRFVDDLSPDELHTEEYKILKDRIEETTR